MPATGRLLLDVAVVLLAARAGGMLFGRLGQPPVIGELAAGVALGPTVLGAFPGDPSSSLFPAGVQQVLILIGQLGLVLFMFTVGWDLDLKFIGRRRGAAAAVSITSITVPFALGLALAPHLHAAHQSVAGTSVPFWPFALFVGAALALTAFPVLARILQETDLSRTQLGGLVLGAAAVDDLVGWSVLAIALGVLASSTAWDYVRILGESVLFIVLTVAVVRPLLRYLLLSASPVREVIPIPAAFVGGYATDAIGIHAVFGAFLIGAAMPRHAHDEGLTALRQSLAPVVALLAPIYFVTAGMTVDIPALRSSDLGDADSRQGPRPDRRSPLHTTRVDGHRDHADDHADPATHQAAQWRPCRCLTPRPVRRTSVQQLARVIRPWHWHESRPSRCGFAPA